MAPYRILVVDDSAFMRKIISDLITQDPQFEIVATAGNGLEGVAAVREWKPDAVTLDLEMPLLNGLEALKLIMKENPTPVIMLSGISEDNTRETIKALQFGAFDFIRKPTNTLSNDISHVGESLLEKLRIAVLTKKHQPMITIKAEIEKPVIQERTDPLRITDVAKPSIIEKPSIGFKSPSMKDIPGVSPIRDKQPKKQAAPLLHTESKEALKKQPEPTKSKPTIIPHQPIKQSLIANPSSKSGDTAVPRKRKADGFTASFRHIVAIGTSTGGPRALHEVITSLPGDFPAPVLIVQHMPPKFTKSLAQRLNSFSALEVVEAEQGERVAAGVVYIAPGGYHMELTKDAGGYAILLTEQPQRNGHRPSVDVLFESMIAYRELKRHAVVMTGMGSDGSKGLKLLVESGVQSTIAEAEETCVVYGMPRSVVEAGIAEKVLPLQHIASQLVQAVLK